MSFIFSMKYSHHSHHYFLLFLWYLFVEAHSQHTDFTPPISWYQQQNIPAADEAQLSSL